MGQADEAVIADLDLVFAILAVGDGVFIGGHVLRADEARAAAEGRRGNIDGVDPVRLSSLCLMCGAIRALT